MEYRPAPWDNTFQGKWTTALSKLTLSPRWHFATFLGLLLPLAPLSCLPRCRRFVRASSHPSLWAPSLLTWPPLLLALPVSLRAVSPGLTSSPWSRPAAPAICFLDTSLGLSHRCSYSACPRASSPLLPCTRALCPAQSVSLFLNGTAVCRDTWLKVEPRSALLSLPGPVGSQGWSVLTPR